VIFNRGDIVLVDLGYQAKIRPALVVSIPRADGRRNMTVLAPITTETRGGECEVSFPKPQWLATPSVVNLMAILGVDNAKILRRLGSFPAKMDAVDAALARMLGLQKMPGL
jgi:mRNA interferase MazF